jgi:orotate phosphoribosyltransferase
VISTAGQALRSAEQLRDLGAQLSVVLCVIDREAGGRENLALQGLELRSLFRMSELKSPG